MPDPGIYKQLLYRRQFALGPRPVNIVTHPKVFRVGDYYLTVHHDLDVIQVANGNKSLTLLGFILDPRDSTLDNSAILRSLLQHLCSDADPKHFLQHIDVYGGRWILMVDNGATIVICNDALAQRSVYYTSVPINGESWCVTQPGLLADLFHLETDCRAVEFVDAQKRNGQIEYWFPNDTSAYSEVKLLLPNHYLDLSTVKVHRFWPTQELPRLTLRQAANQGATLLKGMMQSAGTRFPLSVSITAGWDSRVVLAATRDVKTEISYFTFKLANARTANADLTVPARLLAKLGKVHRVLEIPDHMDPEFQKIYSENAAMAHEYWGTVAEALLRFIPPSHVRVSGNGSETVRQQFRPTIDRGITPEKLAEWAATREKFALDAFAQWLGRVPKDIGFDSLDLFYWEQKCGQWLALGQVEWDLTNESFTPFNCRSLLATLLSTEITYRQQPRYELYRVLLKELWPEVLWEPINPHKKMTPNQYSFKATLKNMLDRLIRWST